MVRRRRVLHGIALATAGGLAGCSGDGDDGDGEDTTDPEDGDAGTTEAMDGTTEAMDGTTEAMDGTTEAMGGTTEADGTTAGDVTVVTVAPGGSLSFDPENLTVSVGETVRWEWDGSGHNVVVESKPDGSGWEGDDADLYDSGHTHEHQFEVAGEYSYYCNPHRGSGMVGTVTVEE